MAIRFPAFMHAKQILGRSILTSNHVVASTSSDVPKGFSAVYVGERQRKRFVITLPFLNQPSFQDLLHKGEEEFGFDHHMGALIIPCREDIFLDLTSRLNKF